MWLFSPPPLVDLLLCTEHSNQPFTHIAFLILQQAFEGGAVVVIPVL